MNKAFIKKMIKAEKYKYEAIKEILPNECRSKLEELEKDTLDLLKDVVFEMITDSGEEEKDKKIIKKVNVDFSNR